MLRKVLAMRRAALGDKHPAVGTTMGNLASALAAQGRRNEALAMEREALRQLLAALGPEHPTVAFAHNNVGVSLHLMGRHREALASYVATVGIRRTKLGPAHPLTANPSPSRGSVSCNSADMTKPACRWTRPIVR